MWNKLEIGMKHLFFIWIEIKYDINGNISLKKYES
jgi:hypothetical protein